MRKYEKLPIKSTNINFIYKTFLVFFCLKYFNLKKKEKQMFNTKTKSLKTFNILKTFIYFFENS